jgi:hypothetical protein
MSYIDKVLKGGQSNIDIVDFLLKEGFKYGTGALGEGKMYYVASSDLYAVWFALCDDYISLYAEYDCGGEVGSDQFYFKEDDFESFLTSYYESVEWAKDYLN